MLCYFHPNFESEILLQIQNENVDANKNETLQEFSCHSLIIEGLLWMFWLLFSIVRNMFPWITLSGCCLCLCLFVGHVVMWVQLKTYFLNQQLKWVWLAEWWHHKQDKPPPKIWLSCNWIGNHHIGNMSNYFLAKEKSLDASRL